MSPNTSSMIPAVLPPLPRENKWDRHLQPTVALDWLKQGWRDFTIRPLTSLFFGIVVAAVSVGITGGLFTLEWDSLLFPAFAGFMVVGPVLAIGLYEKSRRIEAGEPVSLWRLTYVKPKSGGQILFAGVLLSMLMLTWIRAAVILYALFFGLVGFPGLENIAPMLFTTWIGWSMLIVGTAVGGLFAALSFAISAFSIPMLLSERVDALTAMGTSMALVWNNLRVMIAWGALALALFVLSLATAFLGFIITFPLLGHGTWHAYRTMRPNPERVPPAGAEAAIPS